MSPTPRRALGRRSAWVRRAVLACGHCHTKHLSMATSCQRSNRKKETTRAPYPDGSSPISGPSPLTTIAYVARCVNGRIVVSKRSGPPPIACFGISPPPPPSGRNKSLCRSLRELAHIRLRTLRRHFSRSLVPFTGVVEKYIHGRCASRLQSRDDAESAKTFCLLQRRLQPVTARRNPQAVMPPERLGSTEPIESPETMVTTRSCRRDWLHCSGRAYPCRSADGAGASTPPSNAPQHAALDSPPCVINAML